MRQKKNIRIILLPAICFAIIHAVNGQSSGDIHQAVKSGDLVKVKVIIEADTSLLEQKDQWNNTPLHEACWVGQETIANFLIDKGADVNARNEYGVSVLSAAISGIDECYDIVKRLIDKGAEINVKNSAVGSPLHMAAEKDNIEVAGFLIENGADVNAQGRYGTVLHGAVNPNGEMAKLLIESGAKFQNLSYGNSELHLAAMKGYVNLVQVLIEYVTNINVMNEYNHTPLYYAARHGHQKVAEVLIAAGADKSTIVDANYGKARQLTEKISAGEAYLWFLGGSSPGTGYAVKTSNSLLIFDPPKISYSSEAGLANGNLNPDELADQKIFFFFTRPPIRDFGPDISELTEQFPNARFVLSFRSTADYEVKADIKGFHCYYTSPYDSFSIDGIHIRTIKPARRSSISSTEGCGYLVEADGVKAFHAATHVSDTVSTQLVRYRKEIDYLKSSGSIDFAILPIGFHHLGYYRYEPYLYLIDQLSPNAVYLTGGDLINKEYDKCLKVLSTRDVIVEYPEGGIATGERFHYVTD